MTWNDIEAKWAAMARRVGSDRGKVDNQIASELPANAPELPSEPTELRAPTSQEHSAP